jgi:hypothetical protein
VVAGCIARIGVFNREYDPTSFHSYSEIVSVPAFLILPTAIVLALILH